MAVTRRVAAKPHTCADGHPIAPGEVYLVHTAFPGGDDAGYATAAGQPVHLKECAACATRYGRANVLLAGPCPQAWHGGLAAGLLRECALLESHRGWHRTADRTLRWSGRLTASEAAVVANLRTARQF